MIMRNKLIYLLTALSYYAAFLAHADAAEDGELFKAIMDTQQFEIYLEPNPLRIAGMLMNTEEKRNYIIPPKFNLKGVVYLPEEIKNCFK